MIYLSIHVPPAAGVFLFTPPAGGAKSRLRRLHYGPKIAHGGNRLAVVESNSPLRALNSLCVWTIAQRLFYYWSNSRSLVNWNGVTLHYV